MHAETRAEEPGTQPRFGGATSDQDWLNWRPAHRSPRPRATSDPVDADDFAEMVCQFPPNTDEEHVVIPAELIARETRP